MCVAHGGAMRRKPPQRSEDIESIAALAVIIPHTAKPVFLRAISEHCYVVRKEPFRCGVTGVV